jgi:DNA invertase Pin-like site-specific DNA recombinase
MGAQVQVLEARFRRTAGCQVMPVDWTPVGAWLRVSSDKQDEQNQTDAVINYCIAHRYWVTRWYVVHAKSAYKGEHQKDLDEAVTHMRHGAIRILVIWHSDRIERRHDHGKSKTLPDTLAEFADAGGRVESVQEPQLGQLDFGGQVATYIASLVNNEKSKHLSAQVQLAHDVIRANGAYGPGPLCWGYRIVGEKKHKTIIPTDLCCEVVPRVFQACIDGYSVLEIAEGLDRMGVKTMRGGAWNEVSVWHMLRNMIYAGRRLNSAGVTVMRCEAVITMDTFRRAQDALKNRQKRGPKNNLTKPLLAKLLCARCEDSPMYRISIPARSSRKEPYLYYRCTGRGPRRKGCGNMVLVDAADKAVVSRFLIWDDSPHQIQTWVEGRNWDAEISELTQGIQELSKDPTAEEWAARMAELGAQVVEYTRLNETREKGHYEYTDVLNPDGLVMTKGQYFHDLDLQGRRKYLETHDIRAEKLPSGNIRMIIDGEETAPIPVHRAGLPSLSEKVAQLPEGTRQRLGNSDSARGV